MEVTEFQHVIQKEVEGEEDWLRRDWAELWSGQAKGRSGFGNVDDPGCYSP